MLEYECPRCHKRAIPFWPKPAASIRCLACGTEVTTTFWSVLWCTLPFCVVFVLAWYFIESTPILWTVIMALIGCSIWVNNKFVVWIEK